MFGETPNLQYNIDTINNLRAKIESLSTELTELSAEVEEGMTELEEKWKTPAGRKFFETQSTDWVNDIKKYIEILDILKEMIHYASEQYTSVQSLADNINI